MDPLISIIMPAYNAGRHIGQAIDSVLAQTYANWELIIVNDGSTDDTARVIERYTDPRIHVFHKVNGGIGSARNVALEHVSGDFLCGLDSDDVLPQDSLRVRMQVFEQDPQADIVDGRVDFMDTDLRNTLRLYVPDFEGEPFHELVKLSSKCFMGFSWMIRWHADEHLRFQEDISHGEDLVFYLHYSPGRRYRCTSEPVLLYRRTGHSTMSDVDGLERSYKRIGELLAEQGIADRTELQNFRRLRQRIMAGTYWHARKPLKALIAYFSRG